MKSAWTDAVVNILRAGVHVQGNAELVVKQRTGRNAVTDAAV